MERYLRSAIIRDLEKKMVLLGGPRQVGKTTLALDILGEGEEHPSYLNWDFPHDKSKILNSELPGSEGMIIFDEIHKYEHWRNLIKGIYDKFKNRYQILVTGSARLDYYRRGGDSLQGRFYYHRLHPLSLYEVDCSQSSFEALFQFGGFPEPLLAQSTNEWNRWQRDRISRVIFEDIQSLEEVRLVDKINYLVTIMPKVVGSPLSINSLRKELGVAFESVEKWVSILEHLYFCFRIPPFMVNTTKALKKEKKLYLWDWSLCEKEGPRLENMLASNLLKYCHYQQDILGKDYQLCFLRDREGREVDFVITENGKPKFAVECKVGEKNISPHIPYYYNKGEVVEFYQVHLGTKDTLLGDINTRILPFTTFCKEVLKV